MFKQLIAAVMLIVGLGGPATLYAQADPTPTPYVTVDGLVLQVPPAWTVTEFGVQGVLALANHDRPTSPDLPPGDLTLDLTYTPPSQRPATPPTSTALIQQAAADFIRSGGSVSVIDTFTLETTVGPVTVQRMRGVVGDDAVLLYAFLRDGLPFQARIQTGDADFSAFAADIRTLFSTLRFDTETPPTTPTPSPAAPPTASTAAPAAPPTTPAPADPVVWVQNIAATDSPNGIRALDEVVVLDTETLLVSDSFTSATVAVADGTLLERIPGDPASYTAFLYVQFGPDRVLYGWDVDGTLVKLRADLSVIQRINPDGPEMAFVRSMDFGPDGDLYVYGLTQAAELVVLRYDINGRLQDRIDIDADVRDTLFSSAAVVVRPDGNLLYVDAQLDSRLFSPTGRLVDTAPLQRPDMGSTAPGFVAPSVVVDDAGRVLVLSTLGLTVFGPAGEPVAQLAPIPPDDDARPFAPGEMPTRGDLVMLAADRVAVVGANAAFSVMTVLDVAALVQG